MRVVQPALEALNGMADSAAESPNLPAGDPPTQAPVCAEPDGQHGQQAARTVASVWRLVLRNTSPIAVFNAVGEGPAFYCVHSVTGETASYRCLAELLGPHQRFYGIQVPRERMHGAFAASIAAVAQHHVEAVMKFQPDGPVFLGGWSSGAIIALEMARQLRAHGRDVPLLVAFDGAPCNTGGGISPWHPLYAGKLVWNLPRWVRGKGALGTRWSARMFAQRLFSTLRFQLQVKGSRLRNEQTLEGDAVQTIVDTAGWSSNQKSFIRALYFASRAYVAAPYPGRVLVYEAKTQPLNHLRQIGAAWEKIAGSVEIVQLRTNHLAMFEEPCVQILADHLRARLSALRQA